MQSVEKIIYERTVSSFPVSIGTALALETLFVGRQPPYDPDREIVRVDINNWERHYLSIKTLLRNFIGSISSKHKEVLYRNPKVVARLFMEELEQINELYYIEGRGIVEPVFYLNSYKDIRNINIPVVYIRPVSGSFRQYLEFTNKVFNLIRFLLRESDMNFITVDRLDVETGVKTLVTTHMPYELTYLGKVRKKALLESHTGAFKLPQQWYTKYAHYKEDEDRYRRLPFSKYILFIMGDKAIIKPHKKEIRTRLLDVAEEARFNIATSDTKVRRVLRGKMALPF